MQNIITELRLGDIQVINVMLYVSIVSLFITPIYLRNYFSDP